MAAEKNENETTIQMTKHWYFHPFFKYAVGTLLVLTILLVLYYDTVFLAPIFSFISILFVPIVTSFLFYYLLRPIVYFFEDYNVPRYVTILLIYLLVALFLIFFIAYIGPLLTNQIAALANTSVEALEKVKFESQTFFSRFFNINLDAEILFNVAQQVTSVLSKNLIDFLGYITRIAAILAVIPFIVFYLLKDDSDFSTAFLCYVPEDFGREAQKILKNMDRTLASYIQGVVLVASSVGLLLFIGYLIIGLNYALVLSLITIIFTTIPFLGPFLAIAPAILVGLSESPTMVLKVIVVFVIVQQCESNFISPQIIGQRLNIHPLTIILLLLAAGSLYGLVGLILATPLYALAKVLIDGVYKMYKLHYSHWR